MDNIIYIDPLDLLYIQQTRATTRGSCNVCSTMCNGQAQGHALVGSSLLGLQVKETSQVPGSKECPLLDWIVLSPAELSAAFGVDDNCQPVTSCTCR